MSLAVMWVPMTIEDVITQRIIEGVWEHVGEMTLGIETDTLDIWGGSLNSKEVYLDKNQFFEVTKRTHISKIICI